MSIFKKTKKYIFFKHWKYMPQSPDDKHNYYVYGLCCDNCREVIDYQIMFGIRLRDIKSSIECAHCHCYLEVTFGSAIKDNVFEGD